MSNFDALQAVHSRPTWIEVDLDALGRNFGQLRARAGAYGAAAVMPIVKANAYGHGLVPCALHLARLGADALGVAFVEEGIALRQAGIHVPILVLGGLVGSQIDLFLDHQLDLTVSSIAKLDAVDAQAAKRGMRARVHLKIDTGMERIGVHDYSSAAFLERAARCSHCEIVGIYSHFACAKRADHHLTVTQLANFLAVTKRLEDLLGRRPLRHIASSGSLLAFPESSLDLVRPGVALYGVSPSRELDSILPLEPVLRLRSEVVYFKVVRAGSGVSYEHTWHAPRDTRVVTIPIGYGDGYMRRLSNRGHVLIRGERYPIVGTVCMDMLMVDIGDGTAYNGDEVVLIGAQGAERVLATELAELAETTPHEVGTALNHRLPRKYLGGG
ncbi:MAG: alanine racemase [Deltaproteobacteria bacterium]|nr:alanine racemase [Deltaproteobacteria bacterium]